jgi:hypothetical protein
MDAESMSETVETCCRCGSPLAHEPVLILVQSGPLHSAHPVINLCPACADSMSRWFARRHHARQPEPAAQPIERPARRIASAIAITTTISFASASAGGGGGG